MKSGHYPVAVEGYGAYLSAILLAAVGVFPPVLILFLLPAGLFFHRAFMKVRQAGLDAEHKSVHMGFAAKAYVQFTLSFSLAMLVSRLFAVFRVY